MRKIVLIVASVVSFIEWFNKENVVFLREELNCEVHIACDFDYLEDTDEERTKAYVKKLEDDGVILHKIGFDRSPFGKRNVMAYKQLKRIIENTRFDLIHCHTPTVAMMTRLAAKRSRKLGSAVMYTCHGFHFHNAAPKKNWILYYPVERFLSRYCDYLVTINKEDFNRAKTFHCKNVRYIPSVGVDINRIKQTVIDKKEYKKSLGIPNDGIMLLSVGELIDRKNHEVIIKALSYVSNKNIYYVICGKGPLRKYLEELSEKLGLAERVIFLGFRKDIPEICNAADISAFPSKIEGLGLAGVEAMAAGVPLVSSNVHGILDYVIDGKTGYACSPTDVDAFAEAIEKLASSSELRERMRNNCLKAVEPFEVNNALNAMWDIYKEVLTDSKG